MFGITASRAIAGWSSPPPAPPPSRRPGNSAPSSTVPRAHRRAAWRASIGARLDDVVAHPAAHFVELRHVRLPVCPRRRRARVPSVPTTGSLTVLSARSNAARRHRRLRPELRRSCRRGQRIPILRPSARARPPPCRERPASSLRRASASAVLRRLRLGLLAHQLRSISL